MEENIDVCVSSLFKYIDTFEGFNKNEFRQLLHLNKKESHFFLKKLCISSLMERLKNP